MNRRIRGRAKKQRQRRALIIGGIVLVAILIAFLIRYISVKNAVNAVEKDTIWNNITIDGIEVSGMTADEAKAALETRLAEYQKQKITLIADGAETVVTLGDLGLNIANTDAVVKEAVSYGKEGSVWKRYRILKDLEKETKSYDVTFNIDSEVVATTISDKVPALDDAAVDATIKRENGAFVITEGHSGKKIDKTASVQVIEEHFNAEWKPGSSEKITLVTVVDEPDIKTEDLKKIKDVLGTFSTSFSSGSNRGKNISHAASLINGTVLMPGEEMSASDSMGSRTAENGYLEAGSYLNGTTVQTYGGGVCQVSSTLYNAVLLAELEVTERWAHSMNVDYVQPSMDAAISEGYKDLKFKNNTDAPVYIEGYTVGGKITFTIYGQNTNEAGRKVTYETEVTSRTPAVKKFIASDDAIGTLKKSSSGHDAIKAKLWKVVTVNGSEVSREAVNSSSYATSAATWKVGTATDNAEAKKVLTDAIATQNEDTIKAAIAQAKAIIAAASQPTTTTPVTPTPETPSTPDDSSTPGDGTDSGEDGQQ